MTDKPLIKLIPDSLDNAVKNITDSPTKAIGETFSDLWFLVLGGKIHQEAEKRKLNYSIELEQFHKELLDGINDIPPEKRIAPKMQIVAPAIENAKYCMEEKEVRELFKNLIVASMNSDTVSKVHPAFADIIKQMSPLDAYVLNYFLNSAQVNIPLANIKRVNKLESGYNYMYQNLVKLSQPRYSSVDITLSVENLIRLNVLAIPPDGHITGQTAYEWVYSNPEYIKAKASIDENKYFLDIEKCALRTTSFGRALISICCQKELQIFE